MRGYYKLANPGNPLRYNASGSALPVSGLAHSRGPEEDPFTSLTYSNIETRMDRPKSSKGHQGISVHVSRLFVSTFWHIRNAVPHSIQLRFNILHQ